MVFYLCHLTLHDNVFFASREMGTLYETEKYLHNWALSYALFEGTYIPKPYRLEGENAQRPGYLDTHNEQNLLHLNEQGIYVFPAMPLQWSYQVTTFNVSQAFYHQKVRQSGGEGGDRNYPISYGRAKELAVGSEYITYIMAPAKTPIPRWIRLGKWAAKIRVETVPICKSGIRRGTGEYISTHPLNPLDLPPSTLLLLYNRIVMPPASLVSQAKLAGAYWKIAKQVHWSKLPEWSWLKNLPGQIYLPQGVAYGANALTAGS
ncbi:MAG: type I-D CRISPR-associated protein Cas5/Csc1 [Stenomitos frigidus ULC029]